LGLQARRSSPATAPFSLHAALPIYVSGQRAPRWSNHASRRIGSVVLRGDAPLLFWLRAFSVNRRTLCRSLIQRGVLRDEHARRFRLLDDGGLAVRALCDDLFLERSRVHFQSCDGALDVVEREGLFLHEISGGGCVRIVNADPCALVHSVSGTSTDIGRVSSMVVAHSRSQRPYFPRNRPRRSTLRNRVPAEPYER